MNWIQALLIVSVLVLLVYLLRSRRNARSKAWVKVGYVLFVIASCKALILLPLESPWLSTGDYAAARFDSAARALIEARKRVPWLAEARIDDAG